MSLKKLSFFFLLFLVFLTACSSSNDTKRVEVQSKLLLSESEVNIPIKDNNFALGNKNAPIIMIEFTDYQCPFCKQFFTNTFLQIRENYINTGKVYFVLKEFPLTNIHKHAFNAALAAQCAGAQEKYWEMHDLLFENQEEWSEKSGVLSSFTDYAKDIKLDIDKYIVCMDSPQTKKLVEESMDEAVDIGLTGTPSFIINGKITRGASSYSSLAAYFDEVLDNEE
jgi:protein-disulfide isomerase